MKNQEIKSDYILLIGLERYFSIMTIDHKGIWLLIIEKILKLRLVNPAIDQAFF
jgi:hypothetical protein